MEDERSTQEETEDVEVEAHTRRHGPVEDTQPRSAADEDDDEVEAHARRWGPMETKRHKPSE